MIDLGYGGYVYVTVPALDMSEMRSEISENIRRLLGDVTTNNVEIGCYLIEFWQSKSYVTEVHVKRDWDFKLMRYVETDKFGGVGGSEKFLEYCRDQFFLDKTQVSRFMNVADEFADKEKRELLEKWQAYKYSQLVEMLPLTSEQRDKIKPSMSVKEIREYKKSVATSQQTKKQDTGKFDNRYLWIPDGAQYSMYDRFRSITPKYLCDKCIRLEQRNSELERRVADLEGEIKLMRTVKAQRDGGAE